MDPPFSSIQEKHTTQATSYNNHESRCGCLTDWGSWVYTGRCCNKQKSALTFPPVILIHVITLQYNHTVGRNYLPLQRAFNMKQGEVETRGNTVEEARKEGRQEQEQENEEE